jgi:hypothetical protein
MTPISSDTPELALPKRLSAIALAAWFIAAFTAGAAGLLDRPGRPPFELLVFVVLPIGGFGTAYFASRRFRAFTATLKLTWLVGSHLWRLVGLGFVIGWYVGALPAGFAIPEGLGDIIAALGALALARSLATGSTPRSWLLAWNVFGLVDLVSAISLGVLYSNGPLGFLASGSVTTRPMVSFPVSLIPTFFVPLFILLHLLTFTRLTVRHGHVRALTSRPSPAR